jgi:glycerol-3-phosphate acyltransferase PlsX
MRIAVDAMGGDFAPQNVIRGALDALAESGGRFQVVLVGPEELLRGQLSALKGGGAAPEIVDAPQVVEMHDAATSAVKHKRNSSINVGITLHKEGKVDAFVSAGHSGAVMSTSTLVLGRLRGISRPSIGTFFPTEHGTSLILDAGANVDCRAQHLLEFAVMGSIYTTELLGIRQPRVGLLSIGEEESKGNDLSREAHALLKESRLNFIGNIEGRDVLQGKADVVVCDGFVGNILLKFAESVPAFFKARLKDEASRSLGGKLRGLIVRGMLRRAMKGLDYEEKGGVPVLGVDGVSIIGHGKSTPKAIKNMIYRAEEMVQKNINAKIQEALLVTTK